MGEGKTQIMLKELNPEIYRRVLEKKVPWVARKTSNKAEIRIRNCGQKIYPMYTKDQSKKKKHGLKGGNSSGK